MIYRSFVAALFAVAFIATAHAQSVVRLEAFTGYLMLDSTVNTNTGGRYVDQGGDGIAGGVRIGYDYRVRDAVRNGYWIIGADAEASVSNLSSRNGTRGEDYRLTDTGSINAYLRAGWGFGDGRAVLYTRIGMRLTDWSLTGQGNTWLGGPSVGVGMQFPLAGNWFTRMDYTYTHYPRTIEVGAFSMSVGYQW